MVDEGKIIVEIAYSRTGNAWLNVIEVNKGTNIRQGIVASGILDQCPEIDLEKNPVGIFSKIQPLDALLNEGDRIEIYRPLKINPKEARRERAKR